MVAEREEDKNMLLTWLTKSTRAMIYILVICVIGIFLYQERHLASRPETAKPSQMKYNTHDSDKLSASIQAARPVATTVKTALTSEKQPVQYANASIPFNVSDEVRRTFLPPDDSFHPLTLDKMADFVFVTAASSNHFKESVDAIATIQTLMPEKKMYFFDIGLNKDQIAEAKSWCSVTYRYLNISRLPRYARNLHICAWKPHVIQEALRENSAIFWMDASFRLTGTNFSDAYEIARNNGGFVLFEKTGHSNFAVTHPDMYRYIVTDVEAQKTIEQYGGGMMLIYRTAKVYRDILWWLVRCADEAGCFVPVYRIACRFGRNHFTTFANCHRFDQAAINLILSNILIRDRRMRYNGNKSFFRVVRHPTTTCTIKLCKPAT